MSDFETDPILIETPSGVVDGVNRDFSTAFDFVAGSVAFFEEGILSLPVATGSNTIRVSLAPGLGSRVQVKYSKV